MEEFKVKKIVFSSSATVFGEPEYLPIDEIHPTGKCINPYGRTKYFFEEFLKDLNNSNKPGDNLVSKIVIYDLSFASTETKFKNPITKTQTNIVIFGFFHKKMILSFWLFFEII